MTDRDDRGTNSPTHSPSPQEGIFNLALVYLASRGLHVATELGIADLMMVLLEGPQRTEQEFATLYRRAGLQLTRVIPTPSVLFIVEGVPVQ